MDIITAQALAATFWTTTTSMWEEWDAVVWNITDGKLPTLKNTGGLQTGEAEHIKPIIFNQNNEAITLSTIGSAETISLPVPAQADTINPLILFYQNDKMSSAKLNADYSISDDRLIINMSDVAIPPNISGVKIFVWDSLQSMKPLSEVFEIK